MKTLIELIKRNCKLFFKDKGMFFTAMITPLILLVLYMTFLGNVYEDSFRSAFPEQLTVSDSVINGIVGGQLISSLLAVCCVTVAFCSNMLMVQDKVTGARGDLTVSPVKASTLAVGYYVSTLISTLMICITALGASLIYLYVIGWYLSLSDVLFLILDVILLSCFGTALSSVINYFLSTQGQISAVGSIVSSCYGFVCGAYMPIASFGKGLQRVISFLPGTYATSLLRNHAMRGAFEELVKTGVPNNAIDGIKASVDYNISFFGNTVPTSLKAVILLISGTAALVVYIVLCRYGKKK